MPATLATLAAPGVTGLYYVDLDAVVQHPWTIPSDLLAEHRANLSDVSFGIMDVLRWKVHGSRFYVRDTRRGRDFCELFCLRCGPRRRRARPAAAPVAGRHLFSRHVNLSMMTL